MIIDQIKQDNMTAMKEHNATARNIFGIVMNKYLLTSIEKKAKNEEMTDNDTIAILQKTIKELTEEAQNYEKAGNTQQTSEINAQKETLTKYLPKMLNDEEISVIINSLEDKSLPNIMKHFKSNYAGKVDMSRVSALARGN